MNIQAAVWLTAEARPSTGLGPGDQPVEPRRTRRRNRLSMSFLTNPLRALGPCDAKGFGYLTAEALRPQSKEVSIKRYLELYDLCVSVVNKDAEISRAPFLDADFSLIVAHGGKIQRSAKKPRGANLACHRCSSVSPRAARRDLADESLYLFHPVGLRLPARLLAGPLSGRRQVVRSRNPGIILPSRARRGRGGAQFPRQLRQESRTVAPTVGYGRKGAGHAGV